jgi:hypothetical protein
MEKRGAVLNKISLLIPRYVGYTDISERKNCDKIFRNYISTMLSFIEDQLHARVNTSISITDRVQMNQLNSFRNKINELKSTIEAVPYGESGPIADLQLNENETKSICPIDLELIEHIDELTHTVSEERSASLHQMILEIENIIEKRNLLIRRF